MPAEALYETKGSTAFVTLDRPDVRNALDFEAVQALRRVVQATDADPDIQRVVLRAEGPTFCSGGDINDMLARQGQGAATFERHMEGLADLVGQVRASPNVWVARVQGDAVGAGLGLVLMCDVAVAADTARFGAVFAKVGLVADTGVSVLLSRSIGLRRALDLLLTARLIDAPTAEAWGLLTRVVPSGRLDQAVQEVLEELTALPHDSLGRLKRQVLRNQQVPVADGLLHEAVLQGVAFATPEHAERTRRFREARSGEGKQ